MTAENTISPVVISSVSREKFVLSWLEGKIFKIDIRENAYVELDDLKEIQVHKAQMTNNKTHTVLFVTPRFGNLSKEAREYAASPEASLNCIAKAVIAVNLGMRILTNFFIVVNKPPVPHRAFTKVDEAHGWLGVQMQTWKKNNPGDPNR